MRKQLQLLQQEMESLLANDEYVDLSREDLIRAIQRGAEKLADVLIDMSKEEVERAMMLTALDVSTEDGRMKFSEQKAYINAIRSGRALIMAALEEEKEENDAPTGE